MPEIPVGLPTNFKLMPQIFKDFGYQTHIVGKWHLGFCNEKYTPVSRGFDTFYGFFNAQEDYYTHRVPGKNFEFTL
jgi:arylsulfatase B